MNQCPVCGNTLKDNYCDMCFYCVPQSIFEIDSKKIDQTVAKRISSENLSKSPTLRFYILQEQYLLLKRLSREEQDQMECTEILKSEIAHQEAVFYQVIEDIETKNIKDLDYDKKDPLDIFNNLKENEEYFSTRTNIEDMFNEQVSMIGEELNIKSKKTVEQEEILNIQASDQIGTASEKTAKETQKNDVPNEKSRKPRHKKKSPDLTVQINENKQNGSIETCAKPLNPDPLKEPESAVKSIKDNKPINAPKPDSTDHDTNAKINQTVKQTNNTKKSANKKQSRKKTDIHLTVEDELLYDSVNDNTEEDGAEFFLSSISAGDEVDVSDTSEIDSLMEQADAMFNDENTPDHIEAADESYVPEEEYSFEPNEDSPLPDNLFDDIINEKEGTAAPTAEKKSSAQDPLSSLMREEPEDKLYEEQTASQANKISEESGRPIFRMITAQDDYPDFLFDIGLQESDLYTQVLDDDGICVEPSENKDTPNVTEESAEEEKPDADSKKAKLFLFRQKSNLKNVPENKPSKNLFSFFRKNPENVKCISEYEPEENPDIDASDTGTIDLKNVEDKQKKSFFTRFKKKTVGTPQDKKTPENITSPTNDSLDEPEKKVSPRKKLFNKKVLVLRDEETDDLYDDYYTDYEPDDKGVKKVRPGQFSKEEAKQIILFGGAALAGVGLIIASIAGML